MQSDWAVDTDLATMRGDLESLYLSFEGIPGSRVERTDAGGVTVETVTAPGAEPGRVILLFHGGGFSMGSARSHRHLAQWLSAAAGCPVWVPDYRLVPEHLYPAQLEDARTVYDCLLTGGQAPGGIALMGDSAGGGLALALLGQLRDTGAPLPACACLMSPWLDLECSGDSYQGLADADPVATHDMALAMGQGYVGPGGNLRDPLASPILLDFSGLPPLLFQVGTREIFLDDARTAAAAAEAAGVTVVLREWQDMIHQWHLYAAVVEASRGAIAEQSEFLARHWR